MGGMGGMMNVGKSKAVKATKARTLCNPNPRPKPEPEPRPQPQPRPHPSPQP